MVGSAASLITPLTHCRVRTASDVTFYRNAIRQGVFSSTSLPSEVATIESVTSPVSGLTGLSKCERMVMSSYVSRPRIWTPSSSNGKAVVLHQGHSGTYNSYNFNGALQQFLTAGYLVCGCVMVGGTDEVTSGTSTNHNTNQQPLTQFLGPVSVAINTLETLGYLTVSMVGLSGGGWTTHVYAALDPRVTKSCPIAGGLPLHHPVYYPATTIKRDWEQFLPGLSIGYYEMMVIAASHGRVRQILHSQDDCCFREEHYRLAYPYASEINEIAQNLGGQFELQFSSEIAHQFHTSVINDYVLPIL